MNRFFVNWLKVSICIYAMVVMAWVVSALPSVAYDLFGVWGAVTAASVEVSAVLAAWITFKEGK